MLTRCRNPNREKWHRYGGRGITVCDRWLSFDNFLADMGEPPAAHTLDRKDNDGPYCKENCRWATRAQQARNTSRSRILRCRGEERTLAEWCEVAGRNYETVRYRLQAGLATEEALFGPPMKCKGHTPRVMLTYRGETKSLRDWSIELGVDYELMRVRLRKGYTPEEVVHCRRKRSEG